MILNKQEARKIINLNPKRLIDVDIAERQFEVILKGFNHLNQSKNNFLYIADEVGLGKTYVALGIASLLRHFSSNKDRFSIYPMHSNSYLMNGTQTDFVTFGTCSQSP